MKWNKKTTVDDVDSAIVDAKLGVAHLELSSGNLQFVCLRFRYTVRKYTYLTHNFLKTVCSRDFKSWRTA